MRKIITNLKAAPIIGLLVMLPFMLMEWLTGSDLPRSNFPIQLFIALWIQITIFILLSVSIVKTWRKNKKSRKEYVFVSIKVVVAVIMAWAWLTLMVDQMPCFFGATGC